MRIGNGAFSCIFSGFGREMGANSPDFGFDPAYFGDWFGMAAGFFEYKKPDGLPAKKADSFSKKRLV